MNTSEMRQAERELDEATLGLASIPSGIRHEAESSEASLDKANTIEKVLTHNLPRIIFFANHGSIGSFDQPTTAKPVEGNKAQKDGGEVLRAAPLASSG